MIPSAGYCCRLYEVCCLAQREDRIVVGEDRTTLEDTSRPPPLEAKKASRFLPWEELTVVRLEPISVFQT